MRTSSSGKERRHEVEVGGITALVAADAQAGTQAPPVDTLPKRGRPRIHADRKAYKAMKERERRARLKG